MEKENTSYAEPPTPPLSSLWRRICAMAYDTLLLICIVFIAWQPVPLLPESIPEFVGRILRLTYLFGICFLYFGWFWRHGGQTLGMKAWKIRLVPNHSAKDATHSANGVSWRSIWLRFVMSIVSWVCLGIGFLWALIPPSKLAWHDRFSSTRLELVRR